MLSLVASTMFLGLQLAPLRLSAQTTQAVMQVKPTRAAPVMQEEPDPFEMATAQGDSLMMMLGNLEPPPSLPGLKEAISSGDLGKLRVAQFELLIDQTLMYDTEGEGDSIRLQPTAATMAQDDDLTKEKMRYVYAYGIKMFMAGFLEQETLQEIILERLAKKVGLDGPGFDQWLEMPAVV
mmetsp:Transcript_4345/g.14026  ORF Transcript_4345/g.14026 Transcript_4345/m.14026 type:complete len:180 (+) Transcript_4345:130-669(+)